MSFDKETRNLLAKTVAACRRRLTEDVTDQLRGTFGLHPDGTVLPTAKLTHLTEEQAAAARRLRELLDHYAAGAAGMPSARRKAAYERLVLEISFTALNRLAALRLCEERGLVVECVRKGTASDGFRLFERVSGGALGTRYETYRVFLECLFDELALDLGVLFDRFTPQSAVFPGERCLEEVLDELNKPDLAHLWTEDETIGWIYQYFNPPEERKAMREASQAPHNSRELAVRNQFFTPRYVVEFLTDNTLGRIWYEMRKGDTRLKEECRYLVRRPNEVFLDAGEKAPPQDDADGDLSQEELLKQPVYIEHRPKKDPRDIKVLDPACGSGHFLLYAFDLLETIYEEAWEEQYAVCSRLYAEGGSDERKELSGSDRLAKGDGPGGNDLQGYERFSKGGDLRTHGTNPQGGGIDTIEHSGRTGADIQKGISELSFDSARFGPRSGNPDSDSAAPSVSAGQRDESGPGTGSGSRAVDHRALELALAKVGYDYSNSAFCPLPTAYSSRDDFLKAVPKMIIEHNLYGIDIDPRAVQIAALALWLRAQKTWKRLGLKPAERPRVRKSNIVTAEPMPGEEDMRREFISSLEPELGRLVDLVFEKMELAGEAGSLLRIEEEIREAVRDIHGEWGEMFSEQDEKRWNEAEERILTALEEYAERAENGRVLRRHLFAEDAARGFAFVDLCRKRFDVVLMNPPFGNPSLQGQDYHAKHYSSANNFMYASFAIRGLQFISDRGLLGTLCNRAGLFLPTYETWRDVVFYKETSLYALLDLGFSIVEDAIVEMCGFVVSTGSEGSSLFSACINLLREHDPEMALSEIPRDATLLNSPRVRVFRVNWCARLQGKPLAYWLPMSFLRKIASLPRFENNQRFARQGLIPADDFRFVRTAWEIPFTNVGHGKRWFYYAKGGEYLLYYDDLPLVVNWEEDGAEIRHYRDQNGKLLSRPQNTQHFFLPGLTYPATTASDFSPRILPSGTVFSAKGQAILFKNSMDALQSLSILTTRPLRLIMEVFMGSGGSASSGGTIRDYRCGLINDLPYPRFREEDVERLETLAHQCVEIAIQPFFLNELARIFITPWMQLPRSVEELAKRFEKALYTRAVKLCEMSYEAENIVARTYGFEDNDSQELLDDIVGPHVWSYRNRALTSEEKDEIKRLVGLSVDRVVDEVTSAVGAARHITKKSFFGDRKLELICHRFRVRPDAVLGILRDEETDSHTFLFESAVAVLSYVTGAAFGRWDVRMALDPSLAPKPPAPFDPLPVCPPGMLVGPDGLPAKPGRIVSEEWLRARPDANNLPPDGAVSRPTIPDSEYPLRINWDGILVDDPGFNGARPHRDDIVRRVRGVLDLIWGDRAQEIEQEACEILGVWDLRDYFRKPSGFFRDHLKRYSKSRRKAPIYWPLSTASGSYTIWLYYHRLTDQTLYAAVNKYLEPKIADTERALDRLEEELAAASGREATRLRDRLNEGRSFLGELQDLREELLRVAGLPYKPDLNDGVIINAAPLHRLFRLRSWAKETEKVWKKLEKGDYDWTRMSYNIWPDRVREVCRRDRSIAIAHGLEDICEVEPPAPGKKIGKWRKEKP